MNAAARDESLGSVEMSDGLTGGEVAGALAQIRVDLGHEVPAIARLYLTPVERRGMRQHPGCVPRNSARIVIFVVAVAAIVILIFVTGWADDKAQPGSTGRVPVVRPATNDSP